MNTTRLLRHANAQNCLRLLRDAGPLSKADLARELGITKTTVGYAIRELMDAGLVVETAKEDDAGARGRPGTRLSLDASAVFFLGVEIGPEHISAVLADFVLTTRQSINVPINLAKLSVDGVVEQVVALSHRLLARTDIAASKIHGMGISFTGIVTPDARVFWPGSRDWQGVPLDRLLRKLLPPEWQVRCCNDAAAVALSLLDRLAEKEKENLLVLMLADGVGSARVRHGIVDRGTNGVAGEIGLMNMEDRLSAGYKMFQDTVGYRHFARFMGVTDDPESALKALSRIETPDPDFLAALEDWADHLAAGMLNAIYLLDPQQILITGPLALLYNKVDTRIRQRIRDSYIAGLPVPHISTVVSDQMLPALGACALLREELFAMPALRTTA